MATKRTTWGFETARQMDRLIGHGGLLLLGVVGWLADHAPGGRGTRQATRPAARPATSARTGRPALDPLTPAAPGR